MKKRSNYTPLLAFLFAGLLLIVSYYFLENSQSKNGDSTRITGDAWLESDTLLPFSPVEFDSLTTPTLTAKGQKEKAVALSSLKITTTIQNRIGVTRYEMSFYNGEDRNLEAELNFPLGQGQTITYFAMDINGKMRPGVVVEKEKARVAFETTIRRNIDPGLIEMTKGNNFKARVFPVPPKGYKRIIIEYTEELPSDTKHAYYYLPLRFKDKLKKFDLTVSVFEEEVSPEIISSNSKNLRFKSVERHFVAKFSQRDYLANEPVTMITRVDEKQRNAVFSKEKEDYYFHTSLNIPHRFRKKDKPEKITVFWDASGSRIESVREKEIELLSNYISFLQNVNVEFIPFANSTLERSNFNIKKGKTENLELFLKSIVYDGGSNIKDLPFDECRGEEILLFSDGLSNLNSDLKIHSKKRIYTISSASSADPSFLNSMAENSDAVSIDLTRTSVDDALNNLKMDQLHFMGFENNKQLKEFFPKKGIPPHGILGVSGKLSGSVKELTALYGYGNTIVKKEKIILKEEKEIGSRLKKMWAIKKLAFLDQEYKENKKQITELGINNRLVTRNTSMLVLDRIEDYVEHEIIPPADLQKDYFKQLSKKQKLEKLEKATHFKNVLADFKEQKAWWIKKFTLKKKRPSPDDGENDNYSFNQLTPLSDESNQDILYNISSSEFSATTNGTASSTQGNTYQWSQDGATSSESDARRGSIHVKGWDPKSPYMNKVKAATKEKAYTVYLEEKTSYGDQPSFYLDVADYFIENGQKKIGLRILSNIAELELENHSLLRILAHRLLQLGEDEVAIQLFKELIELRPEEPQSYRDLGLAYAEIGEDEKAIRMLYKLVTEDFDSRFRGIEVIAINEINNIIAKSEKKIDTKFIDKRFLERMPVDIRVVLNWDADNTDVDLWVTDPRGEKCFYSNKYTTLGGRISNDFTQGYGPEEFMIRKAIPGKYKIQAHYYGSSSQSIQGKATLTVQFFKQYGSSKEEKQEIIRRLDVQKAVIDLGEFVF